MTTSSRQRHFAGCFGSSGCSLVGLLALPLVILVASPEILAPSPAEPASPTMIEFDARGLDLAPPSEVVLSRVSPEVGESCATRSPADELAPAILAADPLVGVWHRFEANADGDRIRFYYFHGDGHGLYRYGKVGLSNTHAFDYRVEGERVILRFRRTDERVSIPFRIAEDPEVKDRSWLTLDGDPRDGEGRYFRDPYQPSAACQVGSEARAGGQGIGNRLWSDERSFAAGGMGFAMYQLQAQTIDGRGVGWFHRGDFDEWTTEALTYRRQGDVLTLHFMLSGEAVSTPLRVTGSGEQRALDLDDDPRDFWHHHRYLDRGPSFAAADSLGGGMMPGLCDGGALHDDHENQSENEK